MFHHRERQEPATFGTRQQLPFSLYKK